MMLTNHEQVIELAKQRGMKWLAVAGAGDDHALGAVAKAYECGLARAYLVGDESNIREIAAEHGMDLTPHRIVPAGSVDEAASRAAELVHEGKAQILMKGFMESSTFIKSIIGKEHGLRKPGAPIASVAIAQIDKANRLVFITDPGFMPKPTVEEKIHMVENLVEAMHRIGFECPRVAALCASETVNPKIEATVEAAAVAEYFNRPDAGCVVAGPISFDLAMSEESAAHKNYTHPVAGKADVLLVPNIEAGNTMLKAMQYCGDVQIGGMVTGAKCPVVFSSRSDSELTKLRTIAYAVLTAE